MFTYNQIVHITARSIQIVACVLQWHVQTNKKEVGALKVVFAVCEPVQVWTLYCGWLRLQLWTAMS